MFFQIIKTLKPCLSILKPLPAPLQEGLWGDHRGRGGLLCWGPRWEGKALFLSAVCKLSGKLQSWRNHKKRK